MEVYVTACQVQHGVYIKIVLAVFFILLWLLGVILYHYNYIVKDSSIYEVAMWAFGYESMWEQSC